MTKLYLRIGIVCFLLVFPLVFAYSENATGLPEKPVNLSVTDPSSANNSFTLSWDPVPGAKGYYIYQIPQGRTLGWHKWLSTTPDPIVTPSAEVRRVTLNTNYSYRVTAYNDNGEGLPSDTIDVNLKR